MCKKTNQTRVEFSGVKCVPCLELEADEGRCDRFSCACMVQHGKVSAGSSKFPSSLLNNVTFTCIPEPKIV